MKKILMSLTVLGLVFSFASNADAYVSVKGYYRKDGTYVKPHVRSEPNGLKYDNYSYKPSQGLYNKSYGTKGAEWDTPTWTTDPDYYEGKTLYENGSSGSSIKPNTSNPSVNKVINNPPNSYVFGSNWYCNSGFEKVNNECQKIYNPPNSYVFGSNWYCNSGYKKVGDTCEKILNPPNSYVFGSNWYCNSGFKKVGNQCQKIINPPNSYVFGSNWYCNSGYNKVGSTCEKINNPPNSYVFGSGWYCNYGYYRVGNNCVSK